MDQFSNISISFSLRVSWSKFQWTTPMETQLNIPQFVH